MKIRMLTSIAGHEYTANCGDVIDVAGDEAKRLLEKGYAEPVAEKRTAKAEKRVVSPPETR